MIYQRTIAKEVKVTGIGLHSGKKVTMRLIPQDIDFGIQFAYIEKKNFKLDKILKTLFKAF